MRLYKTTGVNPETGSVHRWDGTQADARARRQSMKAEDTFDKINTEEVDVPIDKAGLLAWLNANVSGE
jgi:hypothetical protein